MGGFRAKVLAGAAVAAGVFAEGDACGASVESSDDLEFPVTPLTGQGAKDIVNDGIDAMVMSPAGKPGILTPLDIVGAQ